MTHRMRGLAAFLVWALILLPNATATVAEAENPAAVLAPYVNVDTFAVGYLNLAALPKSNPDDDIEFLKILPFLSEEGQTWILLLQGVDQLIEVLRSAGVDSVSFVVGLGDLNMQGGPLVLLHLNDGGRPDAVARTLAPISRGIGQWFRGIEVRPHDRNIVLVGTSVTLERYTLLVNRERADLIGPIQKLSEDGAIAAAVVCPGPDFRRVVRELWPELPGPLAPLRAELADRWLHLELAVNLPPDAKPRLALVASDPDAAKTFVTLLQSIPDAVEAFAELGEQRHEIKRQLKMILEVLPPQQDGARVAITLPTDDARLANLRPLIDEATDLIMESTRRERRFRQFKELSLAMLNYESANKHLPAAAIRDKDGRPLLSWRVAVLPYLGENEANLYRQFRLDEPWDSPHNRALIEKMPSVFADPDPKLSALSREGKTTYQVPIAPETIFHQDEGIPFRDITDGTSKTIILVEVEPLRAVVWTKPEDWEVNVQDPLRGVVRTDRRVFTAAFADAHVEAIPVDVDFKKLRGLLTRSGREVFDWP